jgi:hypothetical protein
MKITLCGSMAFYTDMTSARDELTASGHEIKIPELALDVPEEFGGGREVYFGKYIEDNGGMEMFPPQHKIWDLKGSAIQDHFEKIGWGDAVLVINNEKRGVEGYIGGNTLIEIGLAFHLKKQIFILNPISSELSYKQEVYGMKPIILDGDLTLVGK